MHEQSLRCREHRQSLSLPRRHEGTPGNLRPRLYTVGTWPAFKFMSATDKFSDEAIHPTWRKAWELKERANRHRFYSQREQTNKTSRPLAQLPIGAKVFIQNQHGAKPGAWDCTGTVTEQLPHA